MPNGLSIGPAGSLMRYAIVVTGTALARLIQYADGESFVEAVDSMVGEFAGHGFLSVGFRDPVG